MPPATDEQVRKTPNTLVRCRLHEALPKPCVGAARCAARAFQSSTTGASGSGSPPASHLTMVRWLFQAPRSAYTLRPCSSKMCPATCARARAASAGRSDTPTAWWR